MGYSLVKGAIRLYSQPRSRVFDLIESSTMCTWALKEAHACTHHAHGHAKKHMHALIMHMGTQRSTCMHSPCTWARREAHACTHHAHGHAEKHMHALAMHMGTQRSTCMHSPCTHMSRCAHTHTHTGVHCGNPERRPALRCGVAWCDVVWLAAETCFPAPHPPTLQLTSVGDQRPKDEGKAASRQPGTGTGRCGKDEGKASRHRHVQPGTGTEGHRGTQGWFVPYAPTLNHKPSTTSPRLGWSLVPYALIHTGPTCMTV